MKDWIALNMTPGVGPRVTARLLERGMSESDVEKVLGGTFMSVFEAVEGARR